MDPPNREIPAVRRRRKVNRVPPEGSKLGHQQKSKRSDEESTASDSNDQISRNNSTRSSTLSAHKSKILGRRDKTVANQRSHSSPKIEPELPKETSKATDLFAFMKVARRSLSSPRNKDSNSRNASPNPTPNGRSGKSKERNETLENQQLSKLEVNLRRFEEERRKFEQEKRKFDTERRDLDRIRLKRLEERDKKRIAEGYQQLLSLRANEKSRKASLKISDPEERQRLIENFNEAQELCSSQKKDKKRASSSSKKLQPPDIVPSSNSSNVRRSVSLRRPSPRQRRYDPSSSEADADDERKSSLDSLAFQAKVLPTERSTVDPNVIDKDGKLVEKKSPFQWLLKFLPKKGSSSVPKKRFRLIRIPKLPTRSNWKLFKERKSKDIQELRSLTRKCIANIIILVIFCGFGGLIFRFIEGATENFYKCGVKKVKRDFVDQLWASSHNMREEEWKSTARNKLRKFEEELQNAFDLGMSNYSGQKAWSFLNSWVYCFSVVTTIGYGHIAPATTAGRSITIIYSIIGIPIFLIVLADFGKLFTRIIKFVWAYVRGLYYTGSCRRVRKTVPMQDMVKGMNIAYDFMRRPSMYIRDGNEEDVEGQEDETTMGNQLEVPGDIDQNTPQTPMPSELEIDDEFNLPISLALFILISYILFGAALYSMWESWTFFEAFYFVFISMSTIGFGDYVPNHPMFMMASIVYLVFGLALTSMCINVVQLKLSDSFRQASSKIRETIGLDAASSQNETPVPDQKSEVSLKIDSPKEEKDIKAL